MHPFESLSKDRVDRGIDEIKRLCENPIEIKEGYNPFTSIFGNIVYPIIVGLGSKQKLTLFRVTKHRNQPDFDITNPQEFSFNPRPQKVGRAHIPPYPIFYGASNEATAFREMKDELTEGTSYFLSEWEIDFQHKINIHPLLFDELFIAKKRVMNYHMNSWTRKSIQNLGIKDKNVVANLIYFLTEIAKLFSMKQDKYYPITSFYSHNLLYEARKQNIIVDILAYPSVVSGFDIANYAVHPRLINEGIMTLKQVADVLVTDIEKEAISLSIKRVGQMTQEKIQWSKFGSEIFIDFDNCVFEGENNIRFNLIDLKSKQFVGTNTTIQHTIKKFVHKYITENKESLDLESLNLDSFKSEKQTFLVQFNIENSDLFILTNSDKKEKVNAIFVPITEKEVLNRVD